MAREGLSGAGGSTPGVGYEEFAWLADVAVDRATQMRRLSEGELGVALRGPSDDPHSAAVAACAVALEGARRWLGVGLHREQVAAGAAMCGGMAVQMRTGEGKTFAGLAPLLFFAAAGTSVHVATANAYLAERDAAWLGRVLARLGVEVGVSLPGQSRAEKRRGYAAAVTFGAGNDFGFDFLHDNLHLPGDSPVQGGRVVAVVDEADAVLVDNARTPLILSADAAPDGRVVHAEEVVGRLRLGVEVRMDAEHRLIELTDAGVSACESLLGVDNLYAGESGWPHLIHNALRARALLVRDRDYIVAGGRVLPVDELTGRVIDGRRWSEGLQQAVEAKEGVQVSAERQAVARVSTGDYFAGYQTLVGMSGTLEGIADELAAVYGIRTLVVPTHRPVIRVDHPDAVHADRASKLAAVADDVSARHDTGQPVLVGTRSIGDAHAFSALLTDRGVDHQVLTAANDHDEAAIIADAGRPRAVTVATQMAGRGVDIVLGGTRATNDDQAAVRAAGGLFVWGLDHHRAARLDLQVIGRSGRQGDPGASRFAVAPDDDLAAPGVTDPVAAVGEGQRRAELDEAQLRAWSRVFDAPIDAVHARLYDLRRHAADPTTTEPLLRLAIERHAATIDVPGSSAQPPDHRPARRRWRRPTPAARLEEILRQRAAAAGPQRWTGAARLILRTLLVVLWADTLEEIESQKALTSAAAFPVIPQWSAAVDGLYRRFTANVEQTWLQQLGGFEFADTSPPPDDHRSPADVIRLPPSEPGEPDDEHPYLTHWHGWSFNQYVREHFGTRLPDPPVVLVLDAISEPPTADGLTLHLDLAEPSRTIVVDAGAS